MVVSIVHLSDFHFGDHANSVSGKLHALAAAIRAADHTCRHHCIVLSGDIADHGTAPQYGVAKQFFSQLRDAIHKDAADAAVHYLSVPGNHDCYLPAGEIRLRAILVEEIRSTINGDAPDASVLNSLLDRQENYFKFCADLNIATTDRELLYGYHLLNLGGHLIRFNLYNTSFASTLQEQRGTLLMPMNRIRLSFANDSEIVHSVSVFHHPYAWFATETDIMFRSHIEHTSDIALTGHQHFDHGYHKQTVTNDVIFYSEGDVLQERNKPGSSGFRIILLDPESSRRRIVSYSWSGTCYFESNDNDWHPYTRTVALANSLTPTPAFIEYLSDSGLGLTHHTKGPLTLDAVYVFPEITTSTFSGPDAGKDITGENLLNYVTKTPKLAIRGSAYSGKTCLAKSIVKQWLRGRNLFPVLISGREITHADQSYFERLVRRSAEAVYGSETGGQYLQLPLDRKALVIDDWDDSRLAAIERDKFLHTANSHFGHVVLFAQSVSYLNYVEAKIKGTEAILEFEFASMRELSHVTRGKLIDKWLSLELPIDSEQFSRRVEETERLIENIIGKNTLPSLPIIVLAILEAAEQKQDILPENGSFGYLYEVLITTALNFTTGSKPQLDKKYAFLSILAYRMFESSSEMLGEKDLDKLIDEYARSFKVNVDKPALLKDLQQARVLTKQNGNVSFGYTHHFYYFLALYFKNHLRDPESVPLRARLLDIAGGINFSTNRMFLMFVVYLTHDEELMDSLLKMGNLILSEFEPSDFTQEVEFYNSKDFAGIHRSAPEVVDLEASRRKRREAADMSQRCSEPDADNSLPLLAGGQAYSDTLPLATKLEYATSCLEMLGQVLRNFTGSLPGHRKMDILENTYKLGLRSLRAMLIALGTATLRINDELAKKDTSKAEDRQLIKQVEKLLTILGQIVRGSMIRAVSLNVGSADIDDSAYAETLERVGRNDATEMIDLAIKLDHSTEYPYTRIKKLQKQYATNRFAQRVLRDLVIENMHIFKIERGMRQRVLQILGANQLDSKLLSQAPKRLK